ncbi:hypothetical protein REPUB_Repub11eG0108300 [Reevesia pubescens]
MFDLVFLNTTTNPLLSFLALSFISFLVFFLIINFHHEPAAPTKSTLSPQPYPIIGNLLGFLRNRHRFHDWVSDMLSQTPSSTLQVNSFLNLSHGVCTANPTNLQHLLLSNFPNYIKGFRYQDFLHDFLGFGIFGVDAHLWTMQRKISSHEFKPKSLKHFISDVVTSQLSDTLLPCLSIACNENQIIDLQEILQRFTFSNICKVAFGVDVASMENSGFVKAFDDAVEICLSRLLSPIPTIWKMKRLLNLGSEKRFKEAIKIVNDFAMEIIKSKENQELDTYYKENKNIGKSQDLLSRFMSKATLGMEFEDDQEKKRKFLRDIVISFILAGKDSTSTALTWFFWLINGHPRCGRLILDEVATLENLHAALSESLRLFPPVPRDMAYVQMKTIVVALMREFEIVAVGGASAEKMMDPPYTLSLVLKMIGGFRVKLKTRKDWQMANGIEGN